MRNSTPVDLHEATMPSAQLVSCTSQAEPAEMTLKERAAAITLRIAHIEGENPYERQRRERIARNEAILAQLEVNKLASNFARNYLLPTPPPERKAAVRRDRDPLEALPKRRSERQAGVKRSYCEIGPHYNYVEGGRRAKVSSRQGSRGRSIIKVDLIFPRQSDEARDLAWAAARAKAQELGEDRAFAKDMLPSNVAGGFWQQLPRDMQCAWRFQSKTTIWLECRDEAKMPESGWEFQTDAENKRWPTIWLPRTGGTSAGLSGGWRGFSLDQSLTPNDAVVWQIPNDVKSGQLPTYLIVHLFRAEDYETDETRPKVLSVAEQSAMRENYWLPDGIPKQAKSKAAGDAKEAAEEGPDEEGSGVSVDVGEEGTAKPEQATAAASADRKTGKERSAEAAAAPARKPQSRKAGASVAAQAAAPAKRSTRKAARELASPKPAAAEEAEAAVLPVVQPKKGGSKRQRKPSATAAAVLQREWEEEQKRRDKLAAEGLATEEDFDVETVLDVRGSNTTKPFFLIRWAGYSAEHDSWEPFSMFDCNMFAYDWASEEVKAEARKHAKKWRK